MLLELDLLSSPTPRSPDHPHNNTLGLEVHAFSDLDRLIAVVFRHELDYTAFDQGIGDVVNLYAFQNILALFQGAFFILIGHMA